MKLTSFNCTIELSKNENGYSNNYYVDVTDKGVSISHPYITQSQEQVMFVTNLIHDFIATSIAFNNRVDRFNFDNHLEQYAIIPSPSEETTEEEKAIAAAKLSAAQELEEQTLEELDKKTFARLKEARESAASQSCALGGEEVSTEIKDAPFEESKTLAQQIEENVIESLGLK